MMQNRKNNPVYSAKGPLAGLLIDLFNSVIAFLAASLKYAQQALQGDVYASNAHNVERPKACFSNHGTCNKEAFTARDFVSECGIL